MAMVEEQPGAFIMADGLEMRPCVANKVDRSAVRCQLFGRLLGQNKGNCIQKHRRRAGQLAVRLERAAVHLDPTDLWRDQHCCAALGLDLLFQPVDGLLVRTLGEQDTNLATLEDILGVFLDGEGVRQIEVYRFACRFGRFWQINCQPVGDPFGEVHIDIP